MQTPLNIAIAGLGTIGGGTLKVLQENAALLEARCGRKINVVAVLDRDESKKQQLNLAAIKWASSADELVRMPEVEVVVELIGGSEGIAKMLVEGALTAGKHVVTANKALIAHHGVALAKMAEKSQVALAYEAAVAGGIPIIKCLREGLVANHFHSIAGILNGTCNYILTSMAQEHKGFEEALAEAQRIGYAEADPSFDIDGIDTAHKLAILTSLAYGCETDITSVHVEGIRHITATDMQFADELGYTIKLLGLSADTKEGILQRVHPCMVRKFSPIGSVSGAYNGVVIEGSAVGRITLEGKGAGEYPTASSVISDLVDIARGVRYKPFTVAADKLAKSAHSAMSNLKSSYYVRLAVTDRPGVLAAITGIFSEQGISVGSCIQHSPKAHETVQVVIITHETLEFAMQHALKSITALNAVVEPPHMIRIEENL